MLEVGSTKDLGLVLGSVWLGRAVFVLIGGVWADRLPRRTVMISADLVRLGTQSTTAVLLFAGTANVWQDNVGDIEFPPSRPPETCPPPPVP